MLILNENDGIFEELYVFIVLSERDSSGTTERHGVKRNAVKVMERIARRERAKPAKRLAQKLLFVLQKYSCPYFTLFRQLLIIFTPN